MRASLASKMNEVAFPAGAAPWTRLGSGNLSVLVRPKIEGKHGAAKIVRHRSPHEDLEGFSRSNRGHQIHGRVEDAGRLAGLDDSSWRIWKDAGEASCLTGNDIHRNGVASDGGGINPGKRSIHCVVVDQVTGLEVVCAIENQIHSFEQSLNVRGNEVCNSCFDGHLRVKSSNFSTGSNRFG